MNKNLYEEINIGNKYTIVLFPKCNKFDLYIKSKRIIDSGNYEKIWNIDNNILVIHVQDNVYYLITKNIMRFHYEFKILNVYLKNDIVSIYTEKGYINVIEDKYKNYFMIEILNNHLQRDENDKISQIMKKENFRYIPSLVLG